MSREKIEEISQDLRGFYMNTIADTYEVAEHLYNAGYRKQSEGEWKDIDKGGVAINGYMACSVCDVMIPTCDDDHYCLDRLYYCPRCGAKMKGGAE